VTTAAPPKAAPDATAALALARIALTEAIATAYLLIAVVGSGIMAERLSGGNAGLALLANAIATGGALVALILTFAASSGAHMNPVVTLWCALAGRLSWRLVTAYIPAQVLGAIAGVWLAHLMFELPVWQLGTHVRTGAGQWLGEVIATFGLIAIVRSCREARDAAIAVGAYITGAYWFTSSTSFANPAVTIARSFSDTFAGIRPADVLGFILAQLVGLLLALALLPRDRHFSREAGK
jgi:glycerol uptake facilitator-like aquaporin